MPPLATYSSSQRIIFIDVVRAYACFMMVFGHIVNDLLDDTSRNTWFFNNWQHFRGLTAPTFLFVSGFAFYIATTRHWEEYQHFSSRFWKRLRRVVWLLAIGYLLHLPFHKVADLLEGKLGEEQWYVWLNVDILQCVAINLLILHLLILLLKTQRRFLTYIAFAMPLVFLASPLVWYLGNMVDKPAFWNFYLSGNYIAGLPFPLFPWAGVLYLGRYTVGTYYSFFPLFPWIGFMYAGILGAHWYRTRLQSKAHWQQNFFLAGAALAVIGGVLYFPLLSLPAELQFATLQAQSLPLRLAVVIMIFAVISWLARKLRAIPKVVSTIGAETLTIYWMHLVIIYGSAWNLGLVYNFGQRLSLFWCMLVFSLVFAGLTGVVLLKNIVKKQVGQLLWKKTAA